MAETQAPETTSTSKCMKSFEKSYDRICKERRVAEEKVSAAYKTLNEKVDAELTKMREQITEMESKTTKKRKIVKRDPSAYNLFMKKGLAEYKEANDGCSHKDAFAAVAQTWKDASENPKNKDSDGPKPSKQAKKKKAEA